MWELTYLQLSTIPAPCGETVQIAEPGRMGQKVCQRTGCLCPVAMTLHAFWLLVAWVRCPERCLLLLLSVEHQVA